MRKPVVSATLAAVGSIAVNGGSLISSAPPSLLVGAIANPARDLWVDAAWFRHPKKKNIAIGYAALQSVYDKGPEIRQAFGRHHEAACRSREWRKEGGRFCPQMHDYVNNKQYLGEVYEESDSEWDFEVPEL